LFLAISIGKNRATSHDVFCTSALKIRFIDGDEEAGALLRSVRRKYLRPYLIERAVENFRMSAAAIAKELERKSAGVGIEPGEKPPRHLLVVRQQCGIDCEIGHSHEART
jgi:hypothetical protein